MGFKISHTDLMGWRLSEKDRCLTVLLSVGGLESSGWGWEKNAEVDSGDIGYICTRDRDLLELVPSIYKEAGHSY